MLTWRAEGATLVDSLVAMVVRGNGFVVY